MAPYNEIKRSRSTIRQLEMLIDEMLKNKKLAIGGYNGPLGYIKNEKFWRKVASKISAIGPKKTHIQTKTTWRDFKKKVRRKNALVKRLREQPDNEEPIPGFTDLELKVLSIIDNDNSEDIDEVEQDEEQREDDDEEEEIDLFSPDEIPEVTMSVDQNPINVDTSKDHNYWPTLEVGSSSDSKRPLFVEMPQTTPAADEDSSTSPSQYCPQKPSIMKNIKFSNMDDVAKGYADLQAETNKTLKGMVSIFKKYAEDSQTLMKERNEIEKERNLLMKERIEIEEKNYRLKLAQVNMRMKNGSQINDKDKDLNT